MRLFLAAEISAETRAQVRAVREHLRPRLESSSHPPRITWVNDEAAHVTLRFIGEVDDERAHALVEGLTQALAMAPFDVQWDKVGRFPAGRSPRVIWLGAGTGTEQLSDLARLVSARVEPVVGPGEGRPFKPHLTVGRVKAPGRGVDWAGLLSRVPPAATTTRVDHVTLFRSRTSPKGPTYTEISRMRMAY